MVCFSQLQLNLFQAGPVAESVDPEENVNKALKSVLAAEEVPVIIIAVNVSHF